MRRLVATVSLAVMGLWLAPVGAWSDGAHMQIAALAYEKLTAQAKARVDALIKLNPDYPSWVGCLSPEQRDKLAFIRASAWADDIKTDGRHTAVGDTPTGADAGRNVGYADNLLHGYWQSMQTGFSTDEAPVRPPDPVNALTQIRLFTAALQPSSGVSDAIRSYDLVWLVHLVADAHQPLHAARRFTQALASSDQGGNKVLVKPATGEIVLLRLYWDRMLGAHTTPQDAVLEAHEHDGLAQVPVEPEIARIDDPEAWLAESFELAKRIAYAEPVLSGSQPIELTRRYETDARNAVRSQAALAVARLANLLNSAFR